jgi:DNA-binding transcriptional MerR regulator
MNFFTIKDLENLSGIKAHTIRMWEQRYDFLKPQRTESNIRYYDAHELKKMLNIALLNKFGYRVSHIAKMSEAERKEKLLNLTMPRACEERFVTELVSAMTEIDLPRFEEVLDNYILSKGLHRAVQQVIFPFLEKISMLWVTGHVDPVQEHLASGIIREKLIVAIESAYSRLEKNLTFLLFLPEGEFHELGLLYVYYLLKSKGIRVFYLGANIAVEEAASLLSRKKIDYVFVHLTSVTNNFNPDRFLEDLTHYFDGLPVILSGAMIRQLNPDHLSPKLICKQPFSEAIAYLNTL